MHTFTISQAKTHLSRLVRLVLDGEQVVITRKGKPMVEMVLYKGEFKKDK
jgi:prevent-host-death family protein